jgi:hypothetical protein
LAKRLQAAAVFTLGVLLLAWFFRGADFSAIGTSLGTAHLSHIGLALGFTLLTYLLRAYRWKYLLLPVGRARLTPLFVTTVIGFMVNFLLPPGRLGEIARPYLLARREGFSASGAFATIFLERVFDLITVVFLVGVWLLVGPAPGGAESGEALYALKVGGLVAAGGSLGGIAAMALWVRHHDTGLRWFSVVGRRLPRRIESILLRFIATFSVGLGVLKDPVNLAIAAVLSLALWVNICAALWFGALAFDVTFPFGATFLVVGFLTVGVAVPTPGAVGGYHVMYALALTMLFGVDANVAKAAALVNHAIAFVPVSLLGVVLLTWERLSFKEVRSLADPSAPEDALPRLETSEPAPEEIDRAAGGAGGNPLARDERAPEEKEVEP